MKLSKKLIAAACASAALAMGGVSQAADTHTINVSAQVAGNCKFEDSGGSTALNVAAIDPTATGPVQGNATIVYRCTKGTTPVFQFTTDDGTFAANGTGDLSLGAESFPYSFTSSNDGDGTGMGVGQGKNLNVTVTVNQEDAANVTAGTYTDAMTVNIDI